MTQFTELPIANQSGLQFRQKNNAVLSALNSSNAGETEPTVTEAYMKWLDTSTTPPTMRQRNSGNTDWELAKEEELKANLEAATGAELVGVGNGRTQADKNADIISVKDYGAIGDGTYHPLSENFATLGLAQAIYPFVTSLSQSLDWAGVKSAVDTGKIAFAPKGNYVLTDPIVVPSGGGLIGEGCDRWVPGFAGFVEDGAGTSFIAYGTGAKSYTVKHISNCSAGGGVVANPSASDGYTARAPSASYSLIDFTNKNAVGATAATSKAFSALISTTNSGNAVLRDFRVVPYYDGQEGYKSESNAVLGADWDVGLYLYNSQNSLVENVQSVGYWRIAACLKINANDDATEFVEAETDSLYRCTFQGYRGFLARSYDLHRVTAVTASTIEIPWSSSHQFSGSGSVRVSGVDRPYTGLSFSGDKLTFTGISDTSGISVGNELRAAGNNFGTSGTQLLDCYISSLYHHSRLLATSVDLPAVFTDASACIELSGEPLRAYQFIGCTVIGRDDVLVHMHGTGDPLFVGTYFEGQPARDTLNGTLNVIPAGGRFIASATSNSLATYPAGSTRNLRFSSCTYGPGVDRLPRYTSNATARFVTGTGCFKPREVFDDKVALPEHSSETRLESDNGNCRISPAPNGYVYLGNGSSDANVQSASGSLNLLSGLRIRIGSSASTHWYIADSAKFNPNNDNTQTCGSATGRWSVVYAGTGTINTSDGREKTAPSVIDDAVLDAWGDVQLIAYQWLDAIRQKGEDTARWHFGVIAQQVRDVFAAHGLDGTRYGLLCYDEWEDQFDEEGNLLLAAGNRWGIRADQCLFLEAAYQRRRCDRIEQRLTALESK